MPASHFFSKEQKALIADSIRRAEENTSGEIRVHIEPSCKGDVLDRSAVVFAMLGMQKTKQRNGVLFYLAMNDHKFAILGDAGINATVPEGFWDCIKTRMEADFKQQRITEGLVNGILMAGDHLKQYFPVQPDDKNELDNNISFGKE